MIFERSLIVPCGTMVMFVVIVNDFLFVFVIVFVIIIDPSVMKMKFLSEISTT